jgi:mRNA-degrading endonuclease HigB of HigAB toxin-antitoxin module
MLFRTSPTLLPILLILFSHITARCQFGEQSIFIQEVVDHDTITWMLAKDSTISCIYIEKDRKNAIEYRKNHLNTLDEKIKDKVLNQYFTRNEMYKRHFLVTGFSDEALSQLLMISNEKFRMIISLTLHNGKVFNIEIRPLPLIKKNDFLTSSEIHRFINNGKEFLFSVAQEFLYVDFMIPVRKSHLMAEVGRRAMTK